MSTDDTSPVGAEPAGAEATEQAMTPPTGHRTFVHVLVNTAVANITTSFPWFALTFWVYLETRSVLATGLTGGAHMPQVSLFGLYFGILVDRYRKHAVMVGSTLFTVGCFRLAGLIFLLLPSAPCSTSRGHGFGFLRSWC